MIGSVDNFDGEQNLEEWIQMVGRAAEFAGWTEEATFKAAMFRLRGEAGEHAEQLKAEGKIKSWKELQKALKDRFETVGKEQWHQYLLNTGTQGSKTVQEWAQAVRKLSLRALGAETFGIKEEDQPALNAEEERAAEASRKEAKKNLLDYMRRTNFVRGLRSTLRQQVWRKQCKTFDEAVKAAAEEEVVEASHREEQVLSCYKGEAPEVATAGLVEKIVAALELKEAEKKKQQSQGEQNTKEGARPKTHNPRSLRPEEPSEDEYDDEDEDRGQRSQRYFSSKDREIPPNNRPFLRNGPHYGDRLPLPRSARNNPGNEVRGEWRRHEERDGRRTFSYDGSAIRDRDRALNLCFNCHKPGHQARDCIPARQSQQGNGYRRLR